LSLYGEAPRVSFQRTRKFTAGETVSRRDLFTLLRRRAQAQLESDPEPPRTAVARGSAMRGAVHPYRRTLLVYVAQTLASRNLPSPATAAGEPGTVAGASATPFFDVALDEKCDGCGMCLTFCPTHALRSERIDEGVNYAFTVDYCLGCNLCVEVCPREAASLRPAVGRPALGESPALRVAAVHRCANCEAEFPAAGETQQLCPQCAQQQALKDAIRQSLFPPKEGSGI
ncbi:MAG: 4Fe-4S binding protein, partial [Chloroflexota bacterium]